MRRAVPVLVAAFAAVVVPSCSGSEDPPRRLTTVAPTTAPVAESTTSSSSPAESTTTTARGPAGAERCQGRAVRMALLDSRAAAGHTLTVFEVRNTAPRACRLAGHPAVEVLDRSGRVLARAAPGAGSILAGSPPAPVTVGAGGVAYFGVESESVCPDDAPAADSDRVRVVLPDDTAPVDVAAPITVCPRPEILVSPVRASQEDLAG